ncbi:MAG: secondary thiamine-phosphate synthase enzyme YjbQ [bacterium]
MTVVTERFFVSTRGKGTYEITDEIEALVRQSGISTGLATVFVQHTSASLVIYENADPTARADLHRFFEDLVPEDNPDLIHTMEGPDDSTSHLRMVLTRTSESIPIANGKLQLGTWQGIFLFEHRITPHNRTVVVSLIGNRGEG